MRFCILTEKEFRNYIKNHNQASYFQTIETGNLRKSYGTNIHILGVKENDKVIAATLIYDTKTMFNMRTFYAPRGFLIDYHNEKLLSFFTNELVKYATKHNALYIKIEPNVTYQFRDNNGEVISSFGSDDQTINNLKKLGFIHYGFSTDFINQSRFNYILTLDKPYEELRQSFSKSTRKNIESTEKKNIEIRVATRNELSICLDILKKTADRKEFKNNRDLKYFEKMYDNLKSLVTFYIASINTNKYIESLEILYKQEKINNDTIQDKFKVDMIGNKLKKQKEISDQLLKKYQNEIKQAKELKQNYGDRIDIGTLISLSSGNYYLTLYSGMLNEYRNFNPKYAMYNRHILDAYKKNFKYVDFYGICGIFNPKNKYYSIFEMKKGFNGLVNELVGEFSLPISKKYYIYKFFRKVKILLKKLKGEA